MALLNFSKFKLPSDKSYLEVRDSMGQYIPDYKNLGISESDFFKMGENEYNDATRIFNQWCRELMKERKELRKKANEEKQKDHWTQTLDEETKRDLIIKSLRMKDRIIGELMSKPRLSVGAINIYTTITMNALQENYIVKETPLKNCKNMPLYSEEHNSLYGGNGKFVYLWLTSFRKKKSASEMKNLMID